MCFTILQNSKYSKVRISKRDIPCYKNLHTRGNQYIAPYRNKVIYFKQDSTEPVTMTTTFRNWEVDNKYKYNEINAGIHCYSNKKRAKQSMDYDETDMFKAIIPKGTRYFYNPDERQYVAEALTVYPELIMHVPQW